MLRRAAMNRLEHRVLVPDVRTGGHAHAALEDGREVRRDVAEYVRGDRNVIDFGGADEPLLERIDVRVILLDRRVARRDLVVDLAEELAPGGHVRLVDARHTALSVRGGALALFRYLKRAPDYELGALPRDDAAVHRELLDAATIKKAASRRVQALRVLPDDDEVHFPRFPHELEPVVDLVSDVRIEFRRADVRVEIQTESQSKDHTDSCDIAVRQDRVREPDGPEKSRVRGFARLERAIGPLFPGLEVVLAAARKGNEVERDAVRRLHCLQDFHGLAHHFRSDAVPRQEDDFGGHRGGDAEGVP